MSSYCLKVSRTPIQAMGCQQCLLLSVVQLKGKHCRKPHCRNGVIDTFGRVLINFAAFETERLFSLVLYKQCCAKIVESLLKLPKKAAGAEHRVKES